MPLAYHTTTLLAGCWLLAATGCGSPTFTLGPPPTLPNAGLSNAPVPPEASQGTVGKDAGSVQLEVHQSRDIPNLRGALVGLVPLRTKLESMSERFEETLTLGLVDRGVNRLIPGAALASVQGQLERSEGGRSTGTVKLTAPLAALALIGRATHADYLVYGDLSAGTATEESEVGYSLDPEAMQAYSRAFKEYAAEVKAALGKIKSTCTPSLDAYQEAISEFQANGGKLGVDPAGQNAATAKESYAAFSATCDGKTGELRESMRRLPEPASMQDETGRKRARVKVEYTAVQTLLVVRDASNDAAVWIGRFSVKAESLEQGVTFIAQRAAQELTANVGVIANTGSTNRQPSSSSRVQP